jgi:hypothetical protein
MVISLGVCHCHSLKARQEEQLKGILLQDSTLIIMLLAMAANIRLGLGCMAVANTIDYYDTATTTLFIKT